MNILGEILETVQNLAKVPTLNTKELKIKFIPFTPVYINTVLCTYFMICTVPDCENYFFALVFEWACGPSCH